MIDPFAGLPVAALSQSQTLFELGLIVVLAAVAPLIAQVLRLPSILLLLALGFGAGAIGALDPNALLGENLVSAVVSIAVGIILFEAGLGLNVRKLTGSVARVYRRLVSLGILVTWAVGTVAAFLLFDLSLEIALVLGAVLVVSGPTVVGPLLSFIRPSKTVDSVLKWEGTFADPIGATLGVVVFNAVIAGQAKAGEEVAQFLLGIGIGVGFGLARGGPGACLGALVQAQPVAGGNRDLDVRRRDGRLCRSAPRGHGADRWSGDGHDPRQQAPAGSSRQDLRSSRQSSPAPGGSGSAPSRPS